MKISYFAPAAISALLLATACASSPEAAAPADPVAAAQAKTDRLDQRVTKAEKALSESRKNLRDARDKLEKAEDRVTKAERAERKAESELEDARKALSRSKVDLGDAIRDSGVVGDSDE